MSYVADAFLDRPSSLERTIRLFLSSAIYIAYILYTGEDVCLSVYTVAKIQLIPSFL